MNLEDANKLAKWLEEAIGQNTALTCDIKVVEGIGHSYQILII